MRESAFKSQAVRNPIDEDDPDGSQSIPKSRQPSDNEAALRVYREERAEARTLEDGEARSKVGAIPNAEVWDGLSNRRSEV